MRSSRSYTLLELLVVMAMLSVLLGFALPSVVGQRAAGRLSTQVQTTLALTRKARAWATSEGRTVLLLVDADGLRLVRARDPLAEPEGDDPELEPAREGAPVWDQPYTDGVSLLEVEVDGELWEPGEAALSFFPSGESSAGRFVFAAKDLQTELVVDPVLGLARVVEDL
ncbi:MAG: type II secretion system protein [Planctomycetes bacterium]|nr:type II secretion system protein [Planctomycetota bacterium]